MAKIEKLTNPEIKDIIRWLETQIDISISWEVPSHHLEMQLMKARAIYYPEELSSRYSN